MGAEDWVGARELLCVRLDTVGDVVMTTPALRALKEGEPARRLTLLTSTPGAAVAPVIDEVDDVIVYDAPWMKATAERRDAGRDRAMIEDLRARRFDGAVVFTVYSQSPLPSALMCFLADIPLRLAHSREKPYQLLTDWVPDPEPDAGIRHEVQRQLDLVAAIGCSTRDARLSVAIPGKARAAMERRLAAFGIDRSARWVVVHPGATAPSRRYPPESFAAAARRLALEGGVRVVFTGSRDEVGLVEDVRRMMDAPSESLAGALDLADLAALLEAAPLLISNNTAPIHIAAAVGTPVVDLYALTNPQHKPWAVEHRVLSHDVPCRWCESSICLEGHHNCLRLVAPGAVFDAARELLDLQKRGVDAS